MADSQHRDPPRSPTPSTTRHAPRIVVEHAAKALGPYDVLVGVSVQVAAGSTAVVTSPYSMGATSLLEAVLGMVGLDAGRITVGDLSITTADYGQVQRRQRDSGLLFLGGHLHGTSVLSDRTVRRSVETAVRAAGRSGENARERTEALLADFDLADHADRLLSDTVRVVARRAALARVLAHEPDLVVLDEPTTGLASGDRTPLIESLVRARRSHHATFLIGTSDLDLARALADQVVLLHHGTLVATGSSTEVLGDDVTVHELAARFEIAADGARDDATVRRREERRRREREESLRAHALLLRQAAVRHWMKMLVIALLGVATLAVYLSGQASY